MFYLVHAYIDFSILRPYGSCSKYSISESQLERGLQETDSENWKENDEGKQTIFIINLTVIAGTIFVGHCLQYG